MTNDTKKLLRQIFEEAHVVDFDFSKWSRFVRLVVVGQMFDVDEKGRFPMFNIDFLGIKRFEWKLENIPSDLSSEEHCQWTVMDCKVNTAKGVFSIWLWGTGPSPEVSIECNDVAVSSIAVETIDSFNPAWNSPYAPLARPSLEELSRFGT
jgi:hypothetical protein